MKTKNKIILTIFSIIFFMFILIITDVIINLKTYALHIIDKRAVAIAKTVEYSLTSQMVNGTLQDRKLFLEQLADLPNVDKIWLTASPKVTKLYGNNFNKTITYQDDIDLKVLKTGKKETIVEEHLFAKSSYRVTIPYNTSSTGKINCLSCHTNAKEGDTLGAISIAISIDETKKQGIKTIANIVFLGFALLIIILLLVNFIVSPFLSIFDSIKKIMLNAQEGNYSYRINNAKGKESKEVALRVNTLLDKIELSLKSIESKISIFLSGNQKAETSDPLINVKNTIEQISDVYKFRKIIEDDESTDDVYRRLANLLISNFKIHNFNFFEIDTMNGKATVTYSTNDIKCDILNTGCRADKTNAIINSSKFQGICQSCTQCQNINYFCIPYTISNKLDLIISFYAKKDEESDRIQQIIPKIREYIDVAKSIIINKKLMSILERNAQTDALTNLYNRKFLDDSILKITSQASRSKTAYGVLLLDIDHFKMINDTYGHDIGDLAIKIVAKTLLDNIRISDIAIRYGGEEFLILLYNCNEANIVDIANKIRIEFSKKEIPTGGNSVIYKTMSIGISIYPKHSKSLEQCIKYSDLALYEAKNSGRNKVIKFDDSLLEKTN